MTVAMTGVDLAVAGAMVLLYRLCVYWFPVLIGLGGILYTGTSVRSLATSEEAVPDLAEAPRSEV